MNQYLELAKTVKEKGTRKEAARKGMPGTTSLFGYQLRHDLSEGFPLLTTKKLSWKNIVVELLWFLRGDTNIKYLVDNGCNIWCEDTFNYYRKIHSDWEDKYLLSYSEFVMVIKMSPEEQEIYFDNSGTWYKNKIYTLGDCGAQYGWLMRNLVTLDLDGNKVVVDQVKELIQGLKNNPLGRRHIIDNWNVGTLNDMALNACHALVQFNCRPLTEEQKHEWVLKQPHTVIYIEDEKGNTIVNKEVVPEYYLDCQMYQRSADLFLGVPYNIASYALLTHILSKICGMVPGEFIHTFGDVHIYDNHMEQIDLQLTREGKSLPRLKIVDEGNDWAAIANLNFDLIEMLGPGDFILEGYDPHPGIKGKLSTGLI